MTNINMERVREILRQATGPNGGNTSRSLSLKAGLGADAVRDILRGKSDNARIETLSALAVALGGDLALFADHSDGHQVNEVTMAPGPLPIPASMPSDIPIYGTTLGADIDFGTNGNKIRVEATILEPTQTNGFVKRPPSMKDKRDAYALYVVGSSMEPRFRPSERVYVDPRRPPAIGDDVIVQLIDHNGGEGEYVISALIKTLIRRTADGLHLQQYNPAGIFIIPSTDIAAVHRVVPWGELLGD